MLVLFYLVSCFDNFWGVFVFWFWNCDNFFKFIDIMNVFGKEKYVSFKIYLVKIKIVWICLCVLIRIGKMLISCRCLENKWKIYLIIKGFKRN